MHHDDEPQGTPPQPGGDADAAGASPVPDSVDAPGASPVPGSGTAGGPAESAAGPAHAASSPAASPVPEEARPASARRPSRLRRLARLRRPRQAVPAETVPARDPVSAPEDVEPPVQPVSLTLRHPVQTGFLVSAGVGLALALYWVISQNWQLLIWIAAALFIALGLDPIVRRLERWGAPRPVGVIGSVLLLAGLVAAFLSLAIPTVVEQTGQFIGMVPTMVDDIMHSDAFRRLDAQFGVQQAVQDELNSLATNASTLSGLFGGLFGVGTVVFNAGFSALIVLVLTLYFLATLPSVKYWAYRLAPASRRPRVEYLAEQIASSIGHYVMGQSAVAILNGLVAFVGITIAGVPYGALLAFFAGLMAFIPLVGAVTGGLVISLLALTVSWQTALVFAAIYFAYLQVEAYVVSPRVMSKAVKVPGSVVVIAVIAGGALLGVLGALMAIPTAAAVMLIVREVLIPRQDRR